MADDLTAIRAALDTLSPTCRYHGDRIDPAPGLLRREACCDTGVSAMRRRRAEAELERLRAALEAADDACPVYGCTGHVTEGAPDGRG